MTFIFLTQIQEANLPYLFLQSVQQYAGSLFPVRESEVPV